jgi:hypothetical protein
MGRGTKAPLDERLIHFLAAHSIFVYSGPKSINHTVKSMNKANYSFFRFLQDESLCVFPAFPENLVIRSGL